MQALPFGNGLSAAQLAPILIEAGFAEISVGSQKRIAAAQRRGASVRDRLRSIVYGRFALVCRSTSADR